MNVDRKAFDIFVSLPVYPPGPSLPLSAALMWGYSLFVALCLAAFLPQVIHKYFFQPAAKPFFLFCLIFTFKLSFNSLSLLPRSACPPPSQSVVANQYSLTFTFLSLTFSTWSSCRCIMWLLTAGLSVKWKRRLWSDLSRWVAGGCSRWKWK